CFSQVRARAPCLTHGTPAIFPGFRRSHGTLVQIVLADRPGRTKQGTMHELTVIGAESDILLLEGAAGEKFKVTIDESLRTALRSARSVDDGSARRLSPREIQAHIRAGMSATDVASITGAPLEYIEKFEGPVLAERE